MTQHQVANFILQFAFKKQYNLTPKRALILIRLNQAVQLLLYSSLSITDIVYEVGFHSQVVFDRAFKKNFNVSPTEFRQTFLTYENNIIDHREDELLKLVKSKPARPSAT
ncbi:MAG: AraC family transcriptional regulator [Lactococcus sp.]|nr:AraC family transcriptional regulator [Lactococcus sp.]MDN5403920.1 AraC family transcriptional regulator [Lactococcus sp.]MDN5410350.1 AraC family transcriptional regulator [Lactococcus sp.]MDN5412271.1 AraC family transcriptional regulator [Lactococcus sp.]MDN5493190.1 AraC family transcriptional regulator [Lactococcus sp.]MDN6106784.1 AraC family transcriptional regulator [Lactococcus sp.]